MNKSLSALNNRIAQISAVEMEYKSSHELFASLIEEAGELARELKISNKVFGNLHKVADEGPKGESVDLYICCMAMFYFGFIKEDKRVSFNNETRMKILLSLLALEDLTDWPVSEIIYLTYFFKHVGNGFEDYINAAQFAINIFFKVGGTKQEFFEIANTKLTKWEGSQKRSVEQRDIDELKAIK